MHQTRLERGLLTDHDDGSKSLAIWLDRNRCVSVCYVAPIPKLGVKAGRTTVTVESYDPEASLRVQDIPGNDTFGQGVTCAMSLLLILELLRDDEYERLVEQSNELFPETHVAHAAISNARAALMTVRAQRRSRRAG